MCRSLNEIMIQNSDYHGEDEMEDSNKRRVLKRRRLAQEESCSSDQECAVGNTPLSKMTNSYRQVEPVAE